jgi:hypothetical protein
VIARVMVALCLAGALAAEDRWVQAHSGPFTVMSDAGDKAVQERLAYLEQFREALRVTLGKPDLTPVWPVRVLVFKNGRASSFALGRDAVMAAVAEKQPFSRADLRELGRLLIWPNTNRLPQGIEDGLLTLFSTLEVSGTRITLGDPPPAEERTRDWARMQLLATKFDYRGRMRVMISNLEQLPDLEPACRNAFEKSAAEIEREVEAYWKAGSFSTTSVSGRTLSPTRDLHVQPATGNDVKVATADLLLSTGSDQANAAYGAIQGVEADEGLGLIALQKKDPAEARKRLEAAIKADSKNARAWAELALFESDEAKARKELTKAGELNPRWAAVPHRLAQLEKDPARKADQLKKACKLDPRDAAAWEELARAQIDAKQFVEAQKAWAGAERAAANDAERERIHQERLDVARERADFEASERKRESDERQRDINRVKQAGMAEIHAAEDQANRKLNADGATKPLGKVEEWWTGPEAGAKVSGTLERVDCLGRQARLVVRGSDGAVVQLLVRDPGQIVLSGGGVKTLGCGAQRPPRGVTVQYAPKPDKKLGTAGEAATVEFR